MSKSIISNIIPNYNILQTAQSKVTGILIQKKELLPNTGEKKQLILNFIGILFILSIIFISWSLYKKRK
ncbi:LPXTG cell wall anchor domain-containing protein [Lactococcus garvieae]|uniref:LPXTG cell wall anchor domain-containing protein n=1 Tax=Lactococcus garvieae TaxID=1363 RepID=UPI003D77FDD1